MDELHPRAWMRACAFLVTEMSWDYLCDEKMDHEQLDHEQIYLRQVGAVREFAAELMQEPRYTQRPSASPEPPA